MVQIASVLGPALGGLLIAIAGVGWVYAFNARVVPRSSSSRCCMMRDVPRRDRGRRRSARDVTFAAALDGLRFVFRAPLIRSTMLLDFFATFFSSATALLPIFAQDMLHVGARGYGWLYAAPAVGAVIAERRDGAASVDRIERRGRRLLVGGRWSTAPRPSSSASRRTSG